MDDRTLAILGDRAAQERITERGELLPCPFCGGIPSTRVRTTKGFFEAHVICFECDAEKHCEVELIDAEFPEVQGCIDDAIAIWNTRAPILTPEQIKRLEEME